MNINNKQADNYAEQLAIQLRKGFLVYCVLKIAQAEPQYTSDIITKLKNAELVVVEGTIYPMLSRLQKDGLLEYSWHESEQGPPRKYYQTTEYGTEIVSKLSQKIADLTKTLKKL